MSPPFRRVFANSSQRSSVVLEQWVVQQVNETTDPRRVPLSALRAMGTHPMVYLAERTITGVIRRPDLFYVRHPDKRIVKETEEWLWPLLPRVLSVAAHAFAYGTVPIVFNWGREDLLIEVPGANDRPRRRTLQRHTHYVSAHEVWPGDVELETRSDTLLAVVYGKRRYEARRAHVFCWDAEFGSWIGQAARRRAWRDYCMSLLVDLLQAKYLERSVDSPRVAYAPSGLQKVAGAERDPIEHTNHLLAELRGSGQLTLPSTRDKEGRKRYEVETLDLPDRSHVWHKALNRYDGNILSCYLVPPSLGGADDLAAAGAKVLDGMLREFVQDLATWAAANLTELVSHVHAVNHDPAKVPAPEILAYEVPGAVRKLYLEVLRLVSAANRGEAPADWVDVPALLDQLGVPVRIAPAEERKSETPRRPPGRPRDMTGGREERREDARTDEGEEAVGAAGNSVRANFRRESGGTRGETSTFVVAASDELDLGAAEEVRRHSAGQ